MQSIIDLYNHLGGPIASFILTIVGAASVLAAALPKPKEGTFWSFIVTAINYVAVNFGHAKNASTASTGDAK